MKQIIMQRDAVGLIDNNGSSSLSNRFSLKYSFLGMRRFKSETPTLVLGFASALGGSKFDTGSVFRGEVKTLGWADG